ncbi:MAG: zinc ribbon domain-containing protein [Candidatus Hodarchaeales archaeon]|jgi:hypothetical protein
MIEKILTILDEGDHMTDGFGMMGDFGGGWWMLLMLLGGMLIIPILTFWVYQDAQQNGENAGLWALVVFFTMGLGVILYLVLRNPSSSPATNPQSTPPHPSQTQSETVTYSPPTQYNPKIEWENKGGFCENCGAPLTATDSYCPKCGTSIESI